MGKRLKHYGNLITIWAFFKMPFRADVRWSPEPENTGSKDVVVNVIRQ